MNQKFSETKEKLTTMYNKYRTYYDNKAEAKPLSLFSYCLLLNPRLITQSDFASKSLPIWLPLYRVEKILTNSNYIIRKVGTNYTQCVHRIRLRPVEPQGRVDDLRVIDFQNFQRDPSLGQFRGEPHMFDESIPLLLDSPQPVFSTQAEPEVPAPVTVSLNFTPAPAIVPAAPVAAPAPPPAVVAGPGHILAPAPVEEDGSRPDSPASDNDNTHSDSSNENFIADTIKSPPLHHSSTEAIDHETTETPDQHTMPHNLRPRLRPVYYGETRFKSEARLPTTKRFQPTTTMSSGLTSSQEQKRQSILESLERHRQTTSHSTMMQPSGSSPVQSKQLFTQSGYSETPPEYLRRQKEIKSRYSLKNLKKRLSNNDINAIVASSHYPKFCFSQSHILSTVSSFAYGGSSDFAHHTGLAAAVTRNYPALQNLHKMTPTGPPPGSLIAYFDHSTKKFIYNLVTKRKFFHRSNYDTLQMSLLAMKSHMERNNIREIAIPRLGSGYDKLHWPTVFSLIYQIFSNSNVQIVIFQPTRP